MKKHKLIILIMVLLFSNTFHSQEKRNQDEIFDEFKYDINQDGIMDKIIVYNNDNVNTKFEKNHFQLPFKIFIGEQNNTTKLWYENNFLINENKENCIAEGYSNIVFDKNLFTIESQSCYDSNILISIFMTFKYENNKIYLQKYSEEYFDKSDHSRKIPSKVLAEKDFGVLEFNQVNISSFNDK